MLRILRYSHFCSSVPLLFWLNLKLHPSFLYLQTERQLDCALDLMRRLPPQQIEKNLSDLIDLVSVQWSVLKPEQFASLWCSLSCRIICQLCHTWSNLALIYHWSKQILDRFIALNLFLCSFILSFYCNINWICEVLPRSVNNKAAHGLSTIQYLASLPDGNLARVNFSWLNVDIFESPAL